MPLGPRIRMYNAPFSTLNLKKGMWIEMGRGGFLATVEAAACGLQRQWCTGRCHCCGSIPTACFCLAVVLGLHIFSIFFWSSTCVSGSSCHFLTALNPFNMFSFVHAYNVLVSQTCISPLHGASTPPNNPEAFCVFRDLGFWLMASHTNIRAACIHCVIVGALGIRLWGGDQQTGCLWKSAPGVHTNEGVREGIRMGKGKAELWDRHNSSLSQHLGSYGSRMTLPSCPILGQDLLPLAWGEKWDLRQGGFLWLKQYLKGLPAAGVLLTVLPASGATGPSLRGVWATHHSLFTLLPLNFANRWTNKNRE